MKPVAVALLLAVSPFGVTAVSAQTPADMPDIRAQLSPRRYTTLSSELAAKVERLTLHEGDRFREGQVLVGMECSLQRANLAKARAALDGAAKTRAVSTRLHEMKAAGALEADVAEANEGKARADMAAANAIVSKCSVTAPFAGRVAELKVREQQFVQPGTPVMEILDDSVLEVEFLAPSRWLAWMKTGTNFVVAIDETGKTYPARVTRMGARVDPVSQSIKVVGEIVGSHAELMAGMSGKVVMSPKN